MMGGSSASTSWHPPDPARTRSSAARTATTPATSRSRETTPGARYSPSRLAAPEEVETPGVTTIEGLAELLGIDAVGDVEGAAGGPADGTLVLALVRGDDRLSETKL